MLEVIATSVADALAAEAGGADRLEIVRVLDQDGLTPSLDLVRAIVSAVRIPVRVMLRERNAFEVTDAAELKCLCEQAHALVTLPIDGLVLGFLRDGRVDVASMTAVLSAAPSLKVTFHRAFEHVRDERAALDALRPFGQIGTILTSGGHALGDRVTALTALHATVAGRFTVLAGGGVTAPVLAALRAHTPIHAFHVGRAVRGDERIDRPVDAEQVRRLVALAAGKVKT